MGMIKHRMQTVSRCSVDQNRPKGDEYTDYADLPGRGRESHTLRKVDSASPRYLGTECHRMNVWRICSVPEHGQRRPWRAVSRMFPR